MAKGPSKVILAARGRRGAAGAKKNVDIKWFIEKVSNKVTMTMRARVRLATNFLKNKVVKNISRPVTKSTGVRSGRIVVTNRSKPGEFPKADTELLMKSIFEDVRSAGRGIYDGYVGTPLDYGVILELRRDRSFLARTLNENRTTVKRMLTGPIKG